jgi:hypothetical protein
MRLHFYFLNEMSYSYPSWCDSSREQDLISQCSVQRSVIPLDHAGLACSCHGAVLMSNVDCRMSKEPKGTRHAHPAPSKQNRLSANGNASAKCVVGPLLENYWAHPIGWNHAFRPLSLVTCIVLVLDSPWQCHSRLLLNFPAALHFV